MAAEVYEDSLELSVGILEAVLPDSGQYLRSAYPYPSLKPTGRMEIRRFRTVVLENPYLRATIVPDLGGRILRLLDKRTNTEIFPEAPLHVETGGQRGVEVAHGIQFRYANADRLNALGTVQYRLTPADEEGDDAGVWLGEVAPGLSSNILVSIPPDAAELHIEMRMLNRVIGNTPYNGSLSIGLPDAKPNLSTVHVVEGHPGFVLHSKKRDCGISVWCDDSTTASVRHEKGRLLLNRFGPKAKFSLGARQLDTWKFSIVPHSGLGFTPCTAPALALEVGSKGSKLQVARRVTDYKLLVLTKAGQSFESTINAYPEKIVEFDFAGLPARATEVAVLNSGREVILRHLIGSRFAPLSLNRRKNLDAIATKETKSRNDIQLALGSLKSSAKLLPTSRYEAHLLSAIAAMPSAQAEQELEQALLYNSEDHLAWWMKAVCKRSAQDDQQEMPELLNAHYLAPLEPALRAESFLSQPMAQGREANPILRPLRDTPEQFIEAACLLLEIGSVADASRFIDEAMRHEDLPMLRFLQAYALLRETKMLTEAASHIQAGSAKPFAPPFPWRPAEITALRLLAERFPQEARIKEYLAVAEKFAPQMLI